MTSPTAHFQQRRSLSSSTTSSDASDHGPRRDSQTSVASGHRLPSFMEGRVALSHSSPNLGHHLDGANSSTEAPRQAATSFHPLRTHSHGAVASHLASQPNDTYGGQTWMDFLRDSGDGSSVNIQQAPSHSQPNLHAPLPPLPVDSLHGRSSPHYSFPARSSAHTEERSPRSSSERKRRLTTADSPFRRPSSIRMHSDDQAGSSHSPVVIGSSPVAASLQGPSSQSQSSTGRRDSEFVLPRWQPDSEVTHCFVCGSHFTFFYRKHHCR